ncbi:hypothetical protein BC628DRAFT_1078127 [Trametes gibbosa]|nr:hypothetical protein BC628DRAFT_1078127 [Trametes gibbosa]
MISHVFFVLSIVGAAVALYTPVGHHHTSLQGRDDSISTTNLLASCGDRGALDPSIPFADSCTLINIQNNPDSRLIAVLGDPQFNCGGGSDGITVQLGGPSTLSLSSSFTESTNVNLGGLGIGGGLADSLPLFVTIQQTMSYTLEPGRQAVLLAAVLHHSETGNVQANYGTRVFGHFVWITGGTLTRLIPTTDAMFFIHETACGTDATDFGNNS